MRFRAILVVYLVLLFFISFVFPLVYLRQPLGDGDSYAHMYMTDLMIKSSGIDDYYEKLSNRYINPLTNYPFGMWLFSSTAAKITGLSARTIAGCIPVAILFTTLLSTFIFTKIFSKDTNKSLLAVIFSITATTAITFIGFYTWVFALPLFVQCLYVMFNRKQRIYTRLIIFFLLSSTIVLSHTGTAIVMLYLLMTYIGLYVVFMSDTKRLQNYAFFFVFILSMIAVIKLTPDLYLQYFRKLLVLTSVIDSISPSLGWLSDSYYRLIQYRNLQYIIVVWFFYIILLEVIYSIKNLVHRIIDPKFSEFFRKIFGVVVKILPLLIILTIIVFSYPLLINLKFSQQVYNASILAPIVWWGPIQTFLFIFGLKKLDKEYALLTAALTVIIVPFIPLNISTDSTAVIGTGITRFIFYYIVIMSLPSVEGLYNLASITPKRLASIGIISIFSVLFVVIFVGNMYYLPSISETMSEREGLGFIKNAAPQTYVALGPNMRQRIELYGGVKDAAWTTSYGDMNYLSRCIEISSYSECLREFDIDYVIDSGRTRKIGVRNVQANAGHMDNVYQTNEFTVYKLNDP